MKYPVLYIDTGKIEQNTRTVAGLLAKRGIGLVAVPKGTVSHPAVVNAMLAGGARSIGDSRIENLRRVRSLGFKGETVLLRAPSPSRAEEAVEVADVSLNSEVETVKALSDAAVRLGKAHRVILMVDLGDLREGVMAEKAPEAASRMDKLPGIEVCGVGVNFACFGGVIPTKEKMQELLDVKERVEDSIGREIDRVSGGNSANMDMLIRGDMPAGITELRIGESILLGTEAVHRKPILGLWPDAFIVGAEVIEFQVKPTKPIGEIGENAFGVVPQFPDRGKRKRVILALGRQDIDPEGLIPRNEGIAVLGASSDHLICDVQDSSIPLKVGDAVTFIPRYSALLRAATSPFVEKVVL